MTRQRLSPGSIERSLAVPFGVCALGASVISILNIALPVDDAVRDSTSLLVLPVAAAILIIILLFLYGGGRALFPSRTSPGRCTGSTLSGPSR